MTKSYSLMAGHPAYANLAHAAIHRLDQIAGGWILMKNIVNPPDAHNIN